MLAIGTQGGRVKMLDVATKTLRFDVEGHNDIVRCVSVFFFFFITLEPRVE